MSKVSSHDRLAAALARIDDPKGEGARACLTVYREAAKAAAAAADARAKAGITLGPLDGAILTIKDLFDVAGEITRAGSKVIAEEGAPAVEDAPVVRRLRAAGAVIVAKTNMSEFAFSGVGVNPHFGTPGNPADRKRCPGGSTAGGAVAVADDMCEITIGSDTGGSCRTPAAFCGIVGYKPSRQRIPTTGAFPLSYTLDSIGPLSKSVAECAVADAVMANESPQAPHAAPLANLRVGIAQGMPLENLDDAVGKAFAAALDKLGKAGVRLSNESLPAIEGMNEVNKLGGGITPTEAYAVHRDRFSRRGDDIDQLIRRRIERAKDHSAADYIAMTRRRLQLIREMDAAIADVDVLAMPTAAVIAPLIADLEDPEEFARRNAMCLRNTAIWNFFDCCAISLPLPKEGGQNVGLMLVARNGHDHRLFRIAAAVEKVVGP